MTSDDRFPEDEELRAEEHDLGEIPASSLNALFADWEGEEGGELIELDEPTVPEPSFGTLADDNAPPPPSESVFEPLPTDAGAEKRRDRVKTHEEPGLFQRLIGGDAEDDKHKKELGTPQAESKRLSLRERLAMATGKARADETPAVEEQAPEPETEQEPAGEAQPAAEGQAARQLDVETEQESVEDEGELLSRLRGDDRVELPEGDTPSGVPVFPDLESGSGSASEPELPFASAADAGHGEKASQIAEPAEAAAGGNELPPSEPPVTFSAPEPGDDETARRMAAVRSADSDAPAFGEPEELLEQKSDGLLDRIKTRFVAARQMAKRDREQDEAARAAGIDVTPPADGLFGKVRAKLAGSTVADLKPEDPSEFEKLLTPLSGSELTLLQQEVRADETIFARIDNARRAASTRQHLGFAIGVLIILAYLAIIGQSYLTEVLPNAGQPGWIPTEIRGDIAGAAIFALGLVAPFLCFFVVAEGVRLLLTAAADRRAIDAVLGTIAMACALMALSSLAAGEVIAALLMLFVFAAVARVTRPLLPENRRRR